MLNKCWPPAPEIAVNRTCTKSFASVFRETDPILVARVLGNEKLNIQKKILPVLPKTELGVKKRIKRMTIEKSFALYENAINVLVWCFYECFEKVVVNWNSGMTWMRQYFW